MNKVSLQVNGKAVMLEVAGEERLLDLLREKLLLTGTKEGCGVGECGACTVILNGDAVCSCMVLAAQCEGAVVETVEVVQESIVGQALQTAFVEEGGVQCGFCTPGVLMSTKALLDREPQPNDEAIYEALEGNLCRCTGYQPIINSVKSVIAKG